MAFKSRIPFGRRPQTQQGNRDTHLESLILLGKLRDRKLELGGSRYENVRRGNRSVASWRASGPPEPPGAYERPAPDAPVL